MSCKGLVELIVLNIGLQAKILSTRTFTIFVIMALVTTFATTPLTSLLYPPWYQRKLEAWKRGEIDWNTGMPTSDRAAEAGGVEAEKAESAQVKKLLVYLRLDTMPTILALVGLFGDRAEITSREHHSFAEQEGLDASMVLPPRSVQVHGVRMVELNERGSTVMKVSEVDEYTAFDPVLNAFRVLGQMFNLAVSGEVCPRPVRHNVLHSLTLIIW
jgi:hypothetical protein